MLVLYSRSLHGVFAFTFRLTFRHASHFVLLSHDATIACQEMVAEMRASVGYDTTILLAGDAEKCHEYLEGLAERVEGRGDVCADVPAEAFEESVKESDDPDITMYGTTSLASFSELVRNVPIDAIVNVQ